MVRPYKKPITSMGVLPTFFVEGEALSPPGGMGEFLVGVQDLPAVSQWQFSVGFQAIANKTGAEIVCRQGNLDIAEAEQEPR